MARQIIFLTKYGPKGASSRYRTLQYLEFVPPEMNYRVLPLFDDAYLEQLYETGKKPLLKALQSYLARISSLIGLGGGDNIFVIENELWPYLPFGFEKLFLRGQNRLVLIYDDAIFHHYDLSTNFYLQQNKNKIGELMSLADCVIVGNSYLANYASAWSRKAVIIPTVADERKYSAPKTYSSEGNLKLLWVGSPATSNYLSELTSVFEDPWFIENIKLILVGAKPFALKNTDVQYLPWQADSEVATIQSCDVGIMPLPDNPWAHGKCGFKLIQYMLAGLPCIASPIGANNDIILHGQTGFFAKDKNDWLASLKQFVAHRQLLESMGRAAKERALEKYTINASKDIWLKAVLG